MASWKVSCKTSGVGALSGSLPVKGLCNPGREIDGEGTELCAVRPGTQNRLASAKTKTENLRFEESE
jgi:hypothetical protein